MAGVVPIVELANPLDQMMREYKAHMIALGPPELKLLRSAEPLFLKGLAQLSKHPLGPIPGAAKLIESAYALLQERLAAVLSASNNGLRIKRNPQLIEIGRAHV